MDTHDYTSAPRDDIPGWNSAMKGHARPAHIRSRVSKSTKITEFRLDHRLAKDHRLTISV